MIDYDLHIHTEYCGHADGMTIQKICRQAEQIGLKTIAITDHIYSPEELPLMKQIRKEVETLKPSCRVLIGAEVDVDCSYTDGRLVTEQLDGLDYILAGFHYVPTLGHLPRGPEDRGMDAEAFLKVWESSLLGIVSNPRIHTLAHPGRLLASSVEMDLYFDHGLKVLEKAADLSAHNQIAWELNELSGYRIPPSSLERWHEIFEMAYHKGVKLIYGSDAHSPNAIGKCEFVEMMLRRLPAGCLTSPEQIPGA